MGWSLSLPYNTPWDIRKIENHLICFLINIDYKKHKNCFYKARQEIGHASSGNMTAITFIMFQWKNVSEVIIGQ